MRLELETGTGNGARSDPDDRLLPAERTMDDVIAPDRDGAPSANGTAGPRAGDEAASNREALVAAQAAREPYRNTVTGEGDVPRHPRYRCRPTQRRRTVRTGLTVLIAAVGLAMLVGGGWLAVRSALDLDRLAAGALAFEQDTSARAGPAAGAIAASGPDLGGVAGLVDDLAADVAGHAGDLDRARADVVGRGRFGLFLVAADLAAMLLGMLPFSALRTRWVVTR